MTSGRKPQYKNQPHIKPSPPSAGTYANGCRCDDCREAKRLAQKRLRVRTEEAAEYALQLKSRRATHE